MGRDVKKFLFDISIAMNCIDEYIGHPKIFANYENNRQLQQAVERNLEIIGEATKRIMEIEPNIIISNARRIVNARNRIIHGYDDIDNAEIWSIIINNLPVLKQEIEMLLINPTTY
jgi:uncharacterized protein with HEPN domain